MTRRESHAQATAALGEAAQMLDRAEGLLRRARTDAAVQSDGVYPKGVGQALGIVEGLAKAASLAVCDDCGLPIARCGCAWVQEVA